MIDMQLFVHQFIHYFEEVFWVLLLGFLISGVIHELVPDKIIEKYLKGKGLRPLFLTTIVGMIMPVCCFGSLPIAFSFYKRGASLGSILAFLVATPATSVNAAIVTWKFLGWDMMLYIFLAVLIMAIAIGLITNRIERFLILPGQTGKEEKKNCCASSSESDTEKKAKPSFLSRLKRIFRYAFITLPKDIGLGLLMGLVVAALVSSSDPISEWIHSYLSQEGGYLFSLLFGNFIYMCATASVPMVSAFIEQGLSVGAGIYLLILGPILSYGTVFVLKKEFGIRVLLFFIFSVNLLSFLSGLLY